MEGSISHIQRRTGDLQALKLSSPLQGRGEIWGSPPRGVSPFHASLLLDSANVQPAHVPTEFLPVFCRTLGQEVFKAFSSEPGLPIYISPLPGRLEKAQLPDSDAWLLSFVHLLPHPPPHTHTHVCAQAYGDMKPLSNTRPHFRHNPLYNIRFARDCAGTFPVSTSQEPANIHTSARIRNTCALPILLPILASAIAPRRDTCPHVNTARCLHCETTLVGLMYPDPSKTVSSCCSLQKDYPGAKT